MLRFVLTAGLALTGTGSLPAGEPTAPALADQLGSPLFAEREAAEKRLLALGPAAVPTLRRAVTSADLEVGRRAAAILARLTRAEESARLLAPKLARPDYGDVPLAAAVADLRAKTGIPLLLAPSVADPTRRITAVADRDLPGWEAVEFLCWSAGVREVFADAYPPSLLTGRPADDHAVRGRPSNYQIPGQLPPLTPGTAPVLLADGGYRSLPGERAGAVRVQALPAAFPDTRITRGAGQLHLNLDVTPQPHVPWRELVAVRVTRAEADTGRQLAVDFRPEPPSALSYHDHMLLGGLRGGFIVRQGNGVILLNEDGRTPMTAAPIENPRVVPVTLRTDDLVVRRLARLEGVVVAEINVPNAPLVEVGGLDSPAGASADGPTGERLVVSGYRATPAGAELTLEVSQYPPWVLSQLRRRQPVVQFAGFGRAVIVDDSHAVAPDILPHLKFIDAAGRPVNGVRVVRSEPSGNGERMVNRYTLAFPRADEAGPPARLVLTGSRITTVEVPFQLADVPVP